MTVNADPNGSSRLAAAEGGDRLVVDAIPAQVWRAAPDGAIQYVNQQWLDYTGLSQQQSQGWAWATTGVIHADDRSGLLETWQRVIAAGLPDETEARVRRADGDYRWFLIRAVPVRDASGAIVGWYGTNTDIEDRKRAEAMLGEENRLLEMLAQGHPLGPILGGLCRMVERSFRDSFVSIMLLNRDEQRLWYAAPGSLPSAYTERFNGIAIGPSQGSCAAAAYLNEPVIVPDVETDPAWAGHRDIAEAYGIRACWSTPIRSSDGQVVGTFAIAALQAGVPTPAHQRAIAEATHLASVAIAHTRNEAALRRSEAYLAEAQRLSRTGSFGWAVSTGELFWSKETFSILDYAESTRPTLERAFERVHPEDLQRVQQTVASAARDGADLNFEHRLLLPDGSITHVHVQAHAVKGETGALEFVGAVSDVTATRVAEAQLRSSEAESRQIVDAIPQLIVAMSPAGQILYANQSVLHATGLDLAGRDGRRFSGEAVSSR